MSITEKYERTRQAFMDFTEEVGENGETFLKHYSKSYESRIFDEKTKRLMGMVGALASGCEACMIGQCRRAIENGATRAEVIEACEVAFSLGGTMAGSRVSTVLQYMEENGVK